MQCHLIIIYYICRRITLFCKFCMKALCTLRGFCGHIWPAIMEPDTLWRSRPKKKVSRILAKKKNTEVNSKQRDWTVQKGSSAVRTPKMKLTSVKMKVKIICSLHHHPHPPPPHHHHHHHQHQHRHESRVDLILNLITPSEFQCHSNI